MGLGDFFSDAVEKVGDIGGGIIHGAGTALSYTDDLVRGAAWAARPDHWDDIGRGVGNVAEFIGENPGKIWDTGFEVGRHIVKEEILDPKNLAINLALTGATIATGGGAGAALVGRMALGAKALRTARIGEEAMVGVRAGRLAMAGRRASRFATKVDDVLEAGPQAGRAIRRAVTGKDMGFIAGRRNALGEAIAGTEGGLVRGALGDIARGSAFRPNVVAQSTRGSQAIANTAWRGRRASTYANRLEGTETAGHLGEELYQINKNPLGYAMEHGGKEAVAKSANLAAKQVAKKAMKGGERKRVIPQESGTVGDGYGGFAPPVMDAASPIMPRAATGIGPDVHESVYERTEVAPIGRRRGAFDAGTQSGTYAPVRSAYA